MSNSNDKPVVTVTLHNGDVYEGVITRRTRSEVRMQLTDGRLNIVPTWSIATVR